MPFDELAAKIEKELAGLQRSGEKVGEAVERNTNEYTLLIAVLLIAFAFFGISTFKNKNINVNPNQSTKTILSYISPKDKKAIDETLQRQKWQNDRLTLLAIVHNHNNAVMKNHRPGSELIFLDQDWTINKLPNSMKLSDQDKLFLKKFLKPQE